jgi:hypothetical protein
MACWLFHAMMVNPQTKQPIQLPPGSIQSFVLNVPGNMQYATPAQKQQAMQYAIQLAQKNNLGTPKGVRYAVTLIEPDTDAVELLCVQPYYGAGAAVQASQPNLSGAHVQGGMPGTPVGQPGQNRPEGARDSSGFQDISDAGLGAGGDNLYGSADDGTFTDLLQGGFGSVEVQRQA